MADVAKELANCHLLVRRSPPWMGFLGDRFYSAHTQKPMKTVQNCAWQWANPATTQKKMALGFNWETSRLNHVALHVPEYHHIITISSFHSIRVKWENYAVASNSSKTSELYGRSWFRCGALIMQLKWESTDTTKRALLWNWTGWTCWHDNVGSFVKLLRENREMGPAQFPMILEVHTHTNVFPEHFQFSLLPLLRPITSSSSAHCLSASEKCYHSCWTMISAKSRIVR